MSNRHSWVTNMTLCVCCRACGRYEIIISAIIINKQFTMKKHHESKREAQGVLLKYTGYETRWIAGSKIKMATTNLCRCVIVCFFYSLRSQTAMLHKSIANEANANDERSMVQWNHRCDELANDNVVECYFAQSLNETTRKKKVDSSRLELIETIAQHRVCVWCCSNGAKKNRKIYFVRDNGAMAQRPNGDGKSQ